MNATISTCPVRLSFFATCDEHHDPFRLRSIRSCLFLFCFVWIWFHHLLYRFCYIPCPCLPYLHRGLAITMRLFGLTTVHPLITRWSACYGYKARNDGLRST